MQKISSYLYPNRINVVADVAVFPVRWNIVYQNRIKIYQGVDNVLTIDVKNSDQKRIDISEMTLKMSLQDTNGKQFLETDVTPTATTGLATVTISEDDVVNLDPQFLTFSIYRVNEDDSKTIMYADTQFGAIGKMELIGNVVSTATPPRYITRFNPITFTNPNPQYTIWYSDAVEIKKPNYFEPANTDSFELDIDFSGLEGSLVVEYTTENVIGANINWIALDTISITPSTSNLSLTYSNPEYTRDATWLRIRYQPVTNNTGKVDKATVRL